MPTAASTSFPSTAAFSFYIITPHARGSCGRKTARPQPIFSARLCSQSGAGPILLSELIHMLMLNLICSSILSIACFFSSVHIVPSLHPLFSLASASIIMRWECLLSNCELGSFQLSTILQLASDNKYYRALRPRAEPHVRSLLYLWVFVVCL